MIAASPNTIDEPVTRPTIRIAAPLLGSPAVAVGGWIVVEPIPTPDGPMVIVFPLMTVVSVGAPEPMRKVFDPITTSVASIDMVIPATVTADRDGAAVNFAGSIVEEARRIPEPTTIVWPPIVKVVVGAPAPMA